MNVGIETLGMYIPRYGLDLRLLADARGVDPRKYLHGIGQEIMAVPAPDEDSVTLGANAAAEALKDVDTSKIRTLIFATESGIDQSKAGAIYIHQLLGLPADCRTVEMKQACCSSTSAVHFALSTVALNPDEKVLVVCADIARYGVGTAGEPTQGAGAVALVISAEPRVMEIGTKVGYHTEDVMDFWRPNYLDEALVDGKYSIRVYLNALEQSWKRYQNMTGATFGQFDHFCYHLPFTRMALKAHLHLARLEEAQLDSAALEHQVDPSLDYNRRTGNAYTASLYLGLLSLLDRPELDLTEKQIGMFSYGSGCMGAFFGGTVLAGYKEALANQDRAKLMLDRTWLSMDEYKTFYSHELPRNGVEYRTDRYRTGKYRLAGVKGHKRLYEKVSVPMTQSALIQDSQKSSVS